MTKEFLPTPWKKLSRRLGATGGHVRKHAAELGVAGVTAILATLADSPRDLRDAAQLSTASDTLCRESELVAIEMAHLHLIDAEYLVLHVSFSKTNQDGTAPDYRFVSHETMAHVRA